MPFLLAFLLFLALSAPARAEKSGTENLSVLSFDVKADEETDRAESLLILENEGPDEADISLFLPLLSAGMKEGSLQAEASRKAVRETDGSLSFALGAGESISIAYSYQTARKLSNEGVILMDLKELVFHEGGRIGRFRAELTFEEEDLPLVKEICPMNFRLEERTLSFCLYNVQPGALLDRVYVSKETWRNLKGSRDCEPNEEQQFLLSHYREWFENGLGFSGERLAETTEEEIFALLEGLSVGDDPEKEAWEQPWRNALYRLTDGNDMYCSVFDYLYLRELNRAGLKAFYQSSSMPPGILTHRLIPHHLVRSPLMRELIRQNICPEELEQVVAAYRQAPSLEGVPLYLSLGHQTEKGEFVMTHIPQEAARLLHIPISSGDDILRELRMLYTEEGFRYRVITADLEPGQDAEAFAAFLDAVDADYLAVQTMLDDREEDIQIQGPEGGYLYDGFYAVAASGRIKEEEIRTAIGNGRWHLSVPILVLTEEEPLLSGLDLPAWIHYSGMVVTEDGDAVYRYFPSGGAGHYVFGLPAYSLIAAGETGRALQKARTERLAAERSALDARIEAAVSAPLESIPLSEGDECSGLTVLSCEIKAYEETDRVDSELILVNESEKEKEIVLPLPFVSAGCRAGSLVFSASREAWLPDEAHAVFRLPAGESITLRYRYQTDRSLKNAGVILMNLRDLVFQEDAEIGRFQLSLLLKEEDLPLVREIFPANWQLEDRTLSFCLYNVRPNVLLDRVYVRKETWLNVKGSREWELNETQEILLSHCREWLRNGLGLSEEELYGSDSVSVFSALTGRDREAYGQLAEGSFVYKDIFDYLYLRELRRAGFKPVYREDSDPEFSVRIRMDQTISGRSPVLTELLRQTGYEEEAPLILAVLFRKEASLADAMLSRPEWKGYEPKPEDIRYLSETEAALLQAVPGRISSFLSDISGNALRYRFAVIGPAAEADAENLGSYLDAIGAELLICQKMLDNRDGWLKSALPDPNASYFAFYGAAGTLSRKTLEESGNAWWACVLDAEDAVLSELSLPSFIHYTGQVIRREGIVRDLYVNFELASYLDAMGGVPYYRKLLESEEAQTLLKARAERLAEKRKATDDAISVLR